MTTTYPTYPYPPVQPPHPPVQPPRRNHTKMAVAVVAGLAALALSALAIVGVHSSAPSSTPSAAPTTTDTTSVSTSDQWYEAVCKPGTFHNGHGGLRNADNVAFCVSLSGMGTISIGQYKSEFMARDDAAGPGVKSYALTQITDGGYVLFVSYTDRTGALEPLAQYGFTVGEGPMN